MAVILILSAILLLLCLLSYGLRLYLSGAKCLLQQRLDEKLVIVTGCNTGIGFETVGELARRGARVIMACRDLDKCVQAKIRLLRLYGVGIAKATKINVARPFMESILTPITSDQLICEELDLSSFTSVKKFANKILKTELKVDILINNAGVMTSHSTSISDYGTEIHMAINYLGHFLLTLLLMPKLKVTNSSKIINISSDSHYFGKINSHDLNKPGKGSYYARSKLANVIHAIELSKRYKDDGIIAVSLHPGTVLTDLFREPTILNFFMLKIASYFIKTPWEGAQTTVFCALSPKLVPGGYYKNCAIATPNKQALNATVRQCVWETSMKLVESALKDPISIQKTEEK